MKLLASIQLLSSVCSYGIMNIFNLKGPGTPSSAFDDSIDLDNGFHKNGFLIQTKFCTFRFVLSINVDSPTDINDRDTIGKKNIPSRRDR